MNSSLPNCVDSLVNNIQVDSGTQHQVTIQGTQSSQVDNGTQHQVTIQGTQSSQVDNGTQHQVTN
jgi:hypothetical protein